jgi:hypothetical protein
MTHIREKYIPIHTRGLDLNSFKYYRKGVNMSKIRVFVCVPGLIWCNLKKLFVRCGNVHFNWVFLNGSTTWEFTTRRLNYLKHCLLSPVSFCLYIYTQ